jgi:transcription initiation factor TFIIIB Brf1 subunit/transcription initiation factor TFIIB
MRKVQMCKICSQTVIEDDFIHEENICKNCKMSFIADAQEEKRRRKKNNRRQKHHVLKNHV